jgi:8-oxo-dGTP pyrophosphatase MutT (NUDIX family)
MSLLTDATTTPVPSATVIILRESAAGPEVLLGKRRGGRAFGDAHVFPGGVIDPGDSTVGHRCHGLAQDEAGARLGLDRGALDYWVAAVREVFEETGLAFMGGSPLENQQLSAMRRALLGGEYSFAELCQQNNLALQVSGLHYVAHWITPVVRPVRFDTRFFLAELPSGQQARHDGVELIDSVWLTPDAALSAAQRNELKLARPTQAELRRLSRFSSVAGAIQWAAQCWRTGVATNLPVLTGAAGTQRVVPRTQKAGHD